MLEKFIIVPELKYYLAVLRKGEEVALWCTYLGTLYLATYAFTLYCRRWYLGSYLVPSDIAPAGHLRESRESREV